MYVRKQVMKIPDIPYPVSGYLKDVDKSSIVSSATIRLFNKTKGISTPASGDGAGTYNSTTGAYIVDLAQAGSYDDGDVITLDITSGNKSIQYRTTVNLTRGMEEVSTLNLGYYDVLGLIVDLLTDLWDKSTTDNILPTIDRVLNYKGISGYDFANNDYILCYELNENIRPFGLGASKWEHKPPVSVDIRTTFKGNPMDEVRGHLIKMQEEFLRIIKSKVGGHGNFGRILPVRKRDLSDKSVGRGRLVFDVELTKWV